MREGSAPNFCPPVEEGTVFTLEDENGDYIGDGDITIQFTGSRGALEGAYAYYGDDEYDDDCPAGWYNEDTDERVTYSFEPGQGFKVYAATACYLKFPAL